MGSPRFRVPGTLAVVLVALLAPIAGAADPEPIFTQAPIDLDEVREIVPLGNLNPPGHTFPTDHAYLYKADPARASVVYAPAAGTILRVFRFMPDDVKVAIRVTPTLHYTLGHVNPDPGLEEGRRVEAGQRLGVTSHRSFALDLGMVDASRRLPGFVRPERYPEDTLHAVSPFPHFVEPLRSRLYRLIRRSGPDLDGRIDLDVPGRLAGNWFLEGLDAAESDRSEAWERHLAFAVDVHEPAETRIAVGGTLALTGVFRVQSDAPGPAEVGPETGPVEYELRRARGSPDHVGWLRVEMTGPARIRVEVFPAAGGGERRFGPEARVYER